MKRGFTIVELSIVLVVIGIIAGMALKAQAIVETAKRRADVAKIDRIQSAVSVMVLQMEEDIDGFRGLANGGFYDKEIIIDKGLLTEADLKGVTSYVNEGQTWEFFNCANGAAGANAHFLDASYSSASICIRHSALDPSFYCTVEKFMDDENQTSGMGRSQHDEPMNLLKLEDCDNMTTAGEAQADLLIY